MSADDAEVVEVLLTGHRVASEPLSAPRRPIGFIWPKEHTSPLRLVRPTPDEIARYRNGGGS